MKLIIDINEEIYESSKRECEETDAFIIDTLTLAIGNGTPIPDNATNGEWVVDRNVIDTTRKPRTFCYDVHCSKCGFKYAYTTDKEDSIPTNYCPNCGAHMKGADR